MIGIVVSLADRASAHIGEHLLDLVEWDEVADGVYRHGGFELREFEEKHLYLDRVAAAFDDPDYIVVASKHSGETGPLLSAHFTGNFGDAEYGGEPQSLSVPAPNALSHVIRALADEPPEGYDVAMECTHHGPTDLGAPGLFVELGSGPEQWEDPAGARAVAEAILTLEEVEPTTAQTVVAFGGNHYAPRPTRILQETAYAVGHVAADWSLSELGHPGANSDLIEAMFETSGANCALIDGDLPAVERVIEDLGYRIVSETWIRETSGVDPQLVADVEDSLGTVDSGLRFGSVEVPEREELEDGQAQGEEEEEGGEEEVEGEGGEKGEGKESTPAVTIVDLPRELIEECQGIDAEATVGAVADHSVAYQTTENGNRVGERAALAEAEEYDLLIDALQNVLATAYDTVRRETDSIVAERSAFDPETAESLGVPEGPKFGQLAAGQPVEVDGEVVEPESVHSTEIRRFEV